MNQNILVYQPHQSKITVINKKNDIFQKICIKYVLLDINA